MALKWRCVPLKGMSYKGITIDLDTVTKASIRDFDSFLKNSMHFVALKNMQRY